MTKSFRSASATVIAFICAFMLAAAMLACPVTAYADQAADKTELNNVIRAAKDARSGIRFADKSSDVGPNFFYVSTDVWSAFSDAIAAGEDVMNDENAGQAEVDKAIENIKAAQETFIADRKHGTKVLPVIKEIKMKSARMQPAKSGVYEWKITFEGGDSEAAKVSMDDFNIQRKPFGKDWKNSKCPNPSFDNETCVMRADGIPDNDVTGANQWRFIYGGETKSGCPIIIQAEGVSTEDLESAKEAAEKAKTDIKVSEDGKDVDPKDRYVTAAEMKAIDDVIDAAESVLRSGSAKQPQVDAAIESLNTATKDFNDSVKQGQKKDEPAEKPSVRKGASAAAADKAITISTSEQGPSGTVFRSLRLRSTKKANTAVTLSWAKPSGAATYVVYGNLSGKANKMKKIATVSKTALTVRKAGGKKLVKGKYYKFIVVALDKNKKVVSTSKVIHVATTGGKAGNVARVTTAAKKNAVTIKKGKTFKLAAKQTADKKKSLKSFRKLAYETSNSKVATVSAKGVITGKAKGTCYVYSYAQDGTFVRVKVTVK